MTKELFFAQMNLLISKFGELHFPVETKRDIWRIVVKWGEGDLARRVTELLQWESPPEPQDFIKAPEKPIVEPKQEEPVVVPPIQENEKAPRSCCSQGYVFGTDSKGYEYVFRCTCNKFFVQEKTIPVWDQRQGFYKKSS